MNHTTRCVAILSSLASCMVGEDPGPALTSSARALTAEKWASCWVDPSTSTDVQFQFDAIVCSFAATSAPYRILRGTFTAKTQQGHGMAALPWKPDQLQAMSSNPYPRSTIYPIQLTFLPNADRRAILGLTANPELTRTITHVDEFSREQPLVFEQPFTLWPIDVEVDSPTWRLVVDDYNVKLPPGVTVDGQTGMLALTKVRHSLREGDRTRLWLMVPTGEKPTLSAKVWLQGEAETKPFVRFAFDGPGRYVFTEQGVTHVGADGTGTTSSMLASCPSSWSGDGLCDACLTNDPDCSVNGIADCHAEWRNDTICDACLGDDPDCGYVQPACPASWRGDGVCDACLGDDPDCASACPAYWRGDGMCDPCLGDDPDCGGDDESCPASWRGDGMCDACLGDDPDCDEGCPATWRGDGFCDACLGDDPDCLDPRSPRFR